MILIVQTLYFGELHCRILTADRIKLKMKAGY